jgi:hypothetical protein
MSTASPLPPNNGNSSDGRFQVLEVLSLEVFGRLSPSFVALIFIAVLATMVAFVSAGIAFASATVAGYCIVGALVVVLAVLGLVWLELRRQVRWTRQVPSMALLGKEIDGLNGLLDGIRRTAHIFLQGQMPGEPLGDELIRANVFLPDYDDQHEAAIAWLKIRHERLRINMSHQPEWDLQFRPGQGSTGRAFALETAQIAVRRSNQSGQCDAVYLLTQEQTEKVDPRLKWVVSFPLKHPGTNSTMGILNIDGLTHEFDVDVLGKMAILLPAGVKEFEERIAKTAKVVLSVQTEGRK